MYTVKQLWISDETEMLSRKAFIQSNGDKGASLAFWVGGEIMVVEITNMQVEKLVEQAATKNLNVRI